MKHMFAKIKKQNGESFAKVLRDYHNGILEIPNVDKIVKHAGNSAQDAEQILQYLFSLLIEEPKKEKVKVPDPFDLLDEAGYKAYYADTLEKQNAIEKYFKKSERLCTFDDKSRYKNYYIINAVKKDVESIRREDFNGKEERQDLYGTSVISIQVSKNGGFISIKNRYNHTVSGCDNTFNSNPDNIIDGLSAAIQEYFDVSFSTKNLNSLPSNFILADKQILKVNLEINAIYYGDTAYVKNGELIEVSAKDHEYLFDYFIFNAKTKTFRLIDNRISDSFPWDFNKVYGGKKSVYVKKHCIYDGDIMLVGV